jgi:formiminotetrahydrofolate cyclodeaminase
MLPLRECSLGDFADLVASREVAPASGAVAAYSVELAAGLVIKAARGSTTGWDEAEGIAAQAGALRRRARPLPDLSAETFSAAVSALRARSSDDELGRTLAEAAEVPLTVLDMAVSVAELAARVVERCDPNHRPEAVGACLLAESAAALCAHLVEVNLASVPGDARVEQAAGLAAGALKAREEVLRPPPR